MKRLTVFFCLLAISMMAMAQTAHWITADDSLVNKPNTWIEFRKEFSLKKKPKKAEAKIAVDTKYWLWVNGQLAVFEGGLKRGPNRTDSYYDVVDLAPWLKKGNNDVRLLLWHFGKPGFSHVNSGKAGVIFDAADIALVSDKSWQSQRLKAYQTCGKPLANYRLPESNIRYKAPLSCVPSVASDQRSSAPPEGGTMAPSIEIGLWGDAPWGKLIERPIPQWRDYGVKQLTQIDTTIVSPSGDDRGASIVLSARLPYNMQMTPIIDLTDNNEGTTIRIETDHVRGGSQDCVRAEYVTKKGRQQYESLGWMNGDVLRVIYPKKANINVHNISYRETGYDCDFEGSFSCSDSIVNRFWQKAMRTLYVNMRDNYFDCPDRERAQWWGDVTILMGQSFYQLSPRANVLMKKAIRELVSWQKPDGTLFSPIPAQNWNQELPAQMLTAISTYGFWYYYMQTGDKETMEYAYPAMKKYLALWTLDGDGLTLYRKGDWEWGDWGNNIDMRLLMAAWHYMALQSAINVAELTGNAEDIADFKRQMESIYKAFNNCWNGYAYRHPSYQGATDDRVQVLAIVSGLADSTKYDPIFSIIKTQEYASPYMEKYVYEALMKTGHGDYALERFKKRFGPMVADTLHTTLYEGWREGGYGGGSTNHAWSGGMLTDICEQVIGLRPTSPGWQTFEVSPRPIIPEATINVPTVKGNISVSYTDGSSTSEAAKPIAVFTMVLTIPKGTTAHVTLPHGNYQTILLNGKKVDAGKLYAIGKGQYHIVARP